MLRQVEGRRDDSIVFVARSIFSKKSRSDWRTMDNAVSVSGSMGILTLQS
jgi:hypothetical protein